MPPDSPATQVTQAALIPEAAAGRRVDQALADHQNYYARLREELARSVTDAALVVVAQRIATVMQADRILVLDDGRLVGEGSHEELMTSCHAYQEIARSQLSESDLAMKGGMRHE